MAKIILVSESFKDYTKVLANHGYQFRQARKKGQHETHMHGSGNYVTFNTKGDEYTIYNSGGSTLKSGRGFRNLHVDLTGLHKRNA